MSSSDTDEDLIQKSLQLFCKGVDALVPLRHFSQHRVEAKIRESVQEECDKAYMHFTRKLKASKISLVKRGALVNEFCLELDKLAEEYVTKNQDYKTESESFLQWRTEVCREDFQSSINAKLLINPDMDLKSVEDFFETGKPKATDYFEHLWKHGNVEGFEEQKMMLEEKLDGLKQKIVKKQTRALEEDEARKSVAEVKKVVIAKSRQIIYDISTLNGKVTKDTLREKAQEIHDSFVSKGKVVKERYETLYLGLLGVLEDSMEFLDEAVEDMSEKDAVEWADKLNIRLQTRFVENEEHWQKRGNGLESPSNELVSTELDAEGKSFGGEVEADEMNITIVAVTSMQTETEDDDDDIHTEMEVGAEVGNDVNLEVGKKRSRQEEELESTSTIVTSSPSTRLRKRSPSDSQERNGIVSNASDKSGGTERTMNSTTSGDNNVKPLNVPDKNGDFLLLCSMLESGADANINSDSVTVSVSSLANDRALPPPQQAVQKNDNRSMTINEDSKTKLINLIDEFPSKFQYLQRQWRSAINIHESWNEGGGAIRDNYGHQTFQAASIVVSASFSGFEHSFRKRPVYKENYDEHEKEMLLKIIHDTSKTTPKGIQNDTFVYLRQFEVTEGRYISHVLAKKEFEPGSFLCFFSGTMMHIEKSVLLNRCQDQLNDFLTIPMPLAEVNQYFTWGDTTDDVVKQLKPNRPLVIQGYSVDGKGNLKRFYISSFLKYAQSIEDSNCEVKLIRDEPVCGRSRNIWFVRATRKIMKDEKLLLAPFWDIPEEETVSQSCQPKTPKRRGPGRPSYRILVERKPRVKKPYRGTKRRRTEEYVM